MARADRSAGTPRFHKGRERTNFVNTSGANTNTAADTQPGLRRSLHLFPAVAINMTQMCGVGPFITIPIMVTVMGGPQAVFGWVLGAILAMADGLVWAELGAAMPGSGGTYIYLREAFQYRTGKLMPFLFIWTMMITIPLIMSTGIIGLVEYMSFLLPGIAWLPMHLIGFAVTVFIIFLLYRRIESIKFVTTVLWVIMLITVILVVAACIHDFSPKLAFTYPSGAFGNHFLVGLGAGLIVGIYDYMGYNTTAYLGQELSNPGRVIPYSIIISIMSMMAVYLALGIGVLGALPWRDVAQSKSVVSLVVENTWGSVAADIATVLVMVTALASVFTGLLGGSRLPYQAAHDGVFFASFGRLHRRLNFPHVALLAMGAMTAFCSFLNLRQIISMLVVTSVLVQSIAQIVALVVLRRRQPTLKRPYKQWLYPLPCVLAMAGWIYVYFSGTILSLILSAAWIIAGLIMFLIWAKINNAWPFGALEVRERYVKAAE